ncbi:inscuteable -like protein [Brachionus plicatilis]|uniref:Inscuteable-like protein n=1 Tax=Brachionus plicatilis TaxID=10195 RepID=A0A3M7QUD2_BRAPC|nr:inscuteable -like protein [Brachionus plicatilis]
MIISRISFLCRNANERNNSDSVLVACLAALRQIAISSESLESSALLIEADIQQLIKPKANESFLQCSSNEESYVNFACCKIKESKRCLKLSLWEIFIYFRRFFAVHFKSKKVEN